MGLGVGVAVGTGVGRGCVVNWISAFADCPESCSVASMVCVVSGFHWGGIEIVVSKVPSLPTVVLCSTTLFNVESDPAFRPLSVVNVNVLIFPASGLPSPEIVTVPLGMKFLPCSASDPPGKAPLVFVVLIAAGGGGGGAFLCAFAPSSGMIRAATTPARATTVVLTTARWGRPCL